MVEDTNWKANAQHVSEDFLIHAKKVWSHTRHPECVVLPGCVMCLKAAGAVDIVLGDMNWKADAHGAPAICRSLQKSSLIMLDCP